MLLKAADAASGRGARGGRALARRRPASASRTATGSARYRCGIALASALRSTGELKRCRARFCWRRSRAGRLRRGRARRIELTAWCAAVEHWLGRHEDGSPAADPRLGRARRPRGRPRAAALQIELAIDGPLHARLRADAGTMGAGRSGDNAREVGDPGADRDRGGRCEASAKPPRGADQERAGAPRGGGRADRSGSPTPSWPRVEAFYYLAWIETASSTTRRVAGPYRPWDRDGADQPARGGWSSR